MASWKNFSVWRGHLPHWRADNVTYYVTFKHKRSLDASERSTLLFRLIKCDGRKLDFAILCVLPEKTEMVFTVLDAASGGKYELSDVVEKAKTKAGKEIIKKSKERWPPFYFESYDRIIRDDEEYEQTWERILSSPVDASICEDPSDYEHLHVAGAP